MGKAIPVSFLTMTWNMRTPHPPPRLGSVLASVHGAIFWVQIEHVGRAAGDVLAARTNGTEDAR